MGVSPKMGVKPHKMDGENNGKPYEQMDDLGGFPPIFGNTHISRVLDLRNKNVLGWIWGCCQSQTIVG